MKRTKGLRALAIAVIGLALAGGLVAAGAGKPDLTVRVIANYGSSTTFTAGHYFDSDYPQLVVKNVGDGPTTGQWITTFKCTPVPGSGPGGTTPKSPLPAEEKFGTTSSPVLAAGQEWTLWVKPNFDVLTAGKFILSGLVELAEDANKSNNYGDITITVVPDVTPITINPVLMAPSLDKVGLKSSVEPTIVILNYREHSEFRPTKGVIIERKSTLSGYQQIAKTVPPGGPVKIDKGDGIARTYQDGPLSIGAYTYRMKAYDDKGESGYSNEMSINVSGPPKQPAPKIIK
jgi:hypothetical protein